MPQNVVAAVGVGSNLDDPVRQVDRAVARIAALDGVEMIAQSSLYQSAPLGPGDQPDYVNAVLIVETRLDPQALLEALQSIEIELGRVRDGARWGPRVIDLDLLVFGDRRIDQDGLVVPHPRMAERNFVLLPLREIAADIIIPGLGALAGLDIDEGEPRIRKIRERSASQ
jgi:2-amino-4-hydroxy-6-hydroxymethyldihydropteridine diphosphokinase